MELKDIKSLATAGETEEVEFKKSPALTFREVTSETWSDLETLFESRGGCVFIGVTPAGKIVGQLVSDKTQQEIAALLQRFEPLAPVAHPSPRPRGSVK